MPPEANFCDHCGHRFALQSDEPPLPTELTQSHKPSSDSHQMGGLRLEQYIPRELLAKLEASRASRAMQGERRIVTILFCDIRGSTAAAEQLDPEEWSEIMNGAFERLIAPVYRFEGTVARLMGDAILAFFGAPIAHEDDPQWAVLAGLEMLAGIQAYHQEIERAWGLDLSVRVGIKTGLVVVGEVGSDLRMEYTAMGDAVNLAARMEQAAAPGTILITEHTYKLVAPLFDFEPLGEIAVKGKHDPVTAYRVLVPRTNPDRLRGIAGLESALIGREEELAILERAMLDLRQGRGGIVCLVGEAGLGKSRLMEDLRGRWEAAGDLLWSQSRGVSYEIDQPYGQFQQHLQSVCAISQADSSQEIRVKLAAALAVLPGGQRELASQVFEHLLAVGAETQGADLEGEAFKRHLFALMTAFWRGWTSETPGVLIFDDLHWVDLASAELLRHLFQLAEREPLLLICAFRPERDGPAWEIRQVAEREYPHRFTEIGLTPLSEAESSALVDSLLTVAEIPPELRHLILQKAEGNPFYVEEVVRDLIDGGALVRKPATDRGEGGPVVWQLSKPVAEIEIPDSLQALLLARIDRLEERSRQILQLAAVIGRNFYYRVLKMIAGAADELDRQLGLLERSDMIREMTRVPELAYSFRHALTQEAAYRSILRKQRREFHRRAGRALETLFPGRREELASVLGNHFFQGGMPETALKYYLLAGDVAMRVFAVSAAIAHYSRAREVFNLNHPNDTAGLDVQGIVHLFTRRGRALELASQFDQALLNYQEFLALVEMRSDPAMQLAALSSLATVYATPTPVQNATLARQVCTTGLDLARQLGDRAAEAKMLWNLLLVNVYSDGDLLEAQEFGERALALAREMDLREQLAYTLNDLWYVYMAIGESGRAWEVLVEARGLWREKGNLAMLADNLGTSHAHRYLIGDYSGSLDFSRQAYELGQSIDNVWSQSSSLLFAGQVQIDYGDIDQAVATIELDIRLSERVGHPGPITGGRADLAWMYARMGALKRALPLAELAYSTARELHPLFKQWSLAVLIRIHLLQGDLKSASAIFERSRAGFRRFAVIPGVPVLHLIAKGELALAGGGFR